MKGRKVQYRGALIGGVLGSLLIANMQCASAQQVGGFEQVPEDQSPMEFASKADGKNVFLRQYRDNSTVFVGRWFAPRTAKELPQSASDLYLETVFTTSSAGFTFSTAMAPNQLLDMFDSLKSGSKVNGASFTQETRIGPISMVPFARNQSQCISFVGQWDPQTQSQRGSRLLGFYCTPVMQQAVTGSATASTPISMIDAQEFAAGFMNRFTVQIPDNVAKPVATATPPAPQPEGSVTTPPEDGIPITTNWQGARGVGTLKFDQPSGEGTMIVDDDQRHCEGIWRHEGGAYQTGTLPFGSWYVYCNDGSFARGNYTSEGPASVTGDGQDNNGQAVYFRQQNQG
ncbi:hypothetical protein [Thalassospira sp. GB04J01]|uniref:hypothetical protein n=1 Tax=Thalassospira sp. GB04J01 TaxID=1485225 RepID=UPI001FCA8049|nr:hypothetical protein [Thalassospira sp. GB04J01]